MEPSWIHWESESSDVVIENSWGSEYTPSSPSIDVSSEISTAEDFLNRRWYSFRSLSTLPIPPCTRHSPLPRLSWADPQEVWALMVKKDQMYTRDYSMLSRHPNLHARMRSILLDWLVEVCEVYRLHRDTYYLALDFIDRYLSSHENLPKSQLQLLGITALFIAAKVEEIYPPKLSEFAYVTDGTCTEEEILCEELIMLKGLNWDLSPVTVNSWLNIFLQLYSLDSISNSFDSFVVPQYSGHTFQEVSRLVDLCMLDINSLHFSYSKIAAAALHHVVSDKLARAVSGYSSKELSTCIQWMAPFATTLIEVEMVPAKFLQKVAVDEMHSIQTHSVDLGILERAQNRLYEVMSSSRESPVYPSVGLLTPPPSDEKSRSTTLIEEDEYIEDN